MPGFSVFRRWTSSSTADRLHKDAGTAWPDYRDEVTATLAASPRDAVLFALLALQDVRLAWNVAHSLALDSHDVWDRLTKDYEKVDHLIAELRETHHRRPRLEDEFDRAGLNPVPSSPSTLLAPRHLAARVSSIPRRSRRLGASSSRVWSHAAG